MSTPPPPLPDIPEATPPKPQGISLAKLAIAFAITIVVTFGLCSITLISSNSAMNGPLFPAAIIIEGICILGLFVVAIIGVIRTLSRPKI